MNEDELREAFEWLRAWMMMYAPEIVAMARGRYAEGVFLYPDGPLYKKTQPELDLEIAREIADACVYARRKMEMAGLTKDAAPNPT